MHPLKVAKNSFFYTLATMLQGLISFFLLPVYTKFLSPEDYAMLALVTSFTGIISSFITLQIHTSIPRFVIKFLKEEERTKKYFTSIFLLLFLILFFGCLIINIFGVKFIKIVFSDKNGLSFSPLFSIATWALLPNLLIGAGLLLLQTLEEGNKFFLISLIQVLVNLLFGLYFVAFLRIGVIGVLFAQLLSCIIGLLSVIWFIRHWFTRALRRLPLEDIKESLKYSLPMIPHILSIYIYMYSDRLILQRFVPLADIGIYSIAGTFAYILLVIVNATTTAYSPRFLKLAEESKSEAKKETKDFLEIWWIVIMVILMGYLVLSKYIVQLMTRPSFFSAVPLIPILAIAYILRGLYCFSVNGIFFLGKTKLIPIITISAALVNVILNIIFIPKFGIYAAAWNNVSAYLITFIFAFYFSEKYYPLIYPWKNMFNVTSLLVVLYIVKLLLENALPVYFLDRVLFNATIFLIFIIATAMLIYRDHSRRLFNIFVNFCKGQSGIPKNIN